MQPCGIEFMGEIQEVTMETYHCWSSSSRFSKGDLPPPVWHQKFIGVALTVTFPSMISFMESMSRSSFSAYVGFFPSLTTAGVENKNRNKDLVWDNAPRQFVS